MLDDIETHHGVEAGLEAWERPGVRDVAVTRLQIRALDRQGGKRIEVQRIDVARHILSSGNQFSRQVSNAAPDFQQSLPAVATDRVRHPRIETRGARESHQNLTSILVALINQIR